MIARIVEHSWRWDTVDLFLTLLGAILLAGTLIFGQSIGVVPR